MSLCVESMKLLSERGSTRATRYATANKIVTIGDRTHVAWLDTISQTMTATFDHRSGAWSAPVKVGDGADNHGGPALTCDSGQHLHIIFGPHNGPFQHCRSAKPNDASQWVRMPGFAKHATYPSAVFDKSDTLHLIFRGGEGVKKLLYRKLPRDGEWSQAIVLARAPIESGYTHYHAALTITSEGALHVSYDIYYNGAAKCAGHMMSRDGGGSWTLADGSALKLPVRPDADVFFKRAERLCTGGIVCDSKGRPWVSMNAPEFWHHDGRKWTCIRPGERVAPPVDAAGLAGLVPPSIDPDDRLYYPATLKGDVVLLYSDDMGETFRMLKVLAKDEHLPHTGMNMERPTGHHRVRVPWLLFSTGEKGPDCFGKGIYHKVHAVRFVAGKPAP